MTARAAEVRAARGRWYAACDRCGWSRYTGSKAGAEHVAALHNDTHHKDATEEAS